MIRFKIAFVVLVVVWALALPTAPLAASWPASDWSSVGHAVSSVVYRIGRLICHQRAERSFSLSGAPLPVCARCTGIYVGAALIAVFAWASARPSGAITHARRLVLLAVAPTAATLLYEWTTGQAPGLWTRAISGTPIGGAVAWIVCAATRAAESNVID